MLQCWPVGHNGSPVVPWCCCSECYRLSCCIRRKRPSQMSWPLLNLKPVLQLTYRTWLRSTSQTSVQWSSRKTWACRVSHWMILTPMFHHSVQMCCLSKQLLSEHSRLLLPVLQRSDTHPLLLSETGSAQFTSRPSSFFFFFLLLNLVFFSLVVASLPQMGKNPKESHGRELCGSPDRLQLCPPSHRTHQVGETLPMLVDILDTLTRLLDFLLLCVYADSWQPSRVQQKLSNSLLNTSR